MSSTRINPLAFLSDELNALRQKGTYFKLRVLDDEQAPVCHFDGRKSSISPPTTISASPPPQAAPGRSRRHA